MERARRNREECRQIERKQKPGMRNSVKTVWGIKKKKQGDCKREIKRIQNVDEALLL